MRVSKRRVASTMEVLTIEAEDLEAVQLVALLRRSGSLNGDRIAAAIGEVAETGEERTVQLRS